MHPLHLGRQKLCAFSCLQKILSCGLKSVHVFHETMQIYNYFSLCVVISMLPMIILWIRPFGRLLFNRLLCCFNKDHHQVLILEQRAWSSYRCIRHVFRPISQPVMHCVEKWTVRVYGQHCVSYLMVGIKNRMFLQLFRDWHGPSRFTQAFSKGHYIVVQSPKNYSGQTFPVQLFSMTGYLQLW